MKRALCLLLLSVILVSCGGQSPQNSVRASVTHNIVNVAGDWRFSGESNTAPAVLDGTFTILQDGTNLSGTAAINGTPPPCSPTATISGSITDDTVTFDVLEDTQLVTFQGIVSSTGESISGTYKVPEGGCPNHGASGVWRADKVKPGAASAGLNSPTAHEP